MNSLTTVRGGGALQYFFYIFYMLNMCSKNRVFTHIFKFLFVNEKNTFVENSRVEPTIFFMEKNHFLWNFYPAILWAILY